MDFWFFYSIVLPSIIVMLGYLALRLHEWDLDRKNKHRQLGN
ncbi:hypothetical protein ABID21_004395 [Pseudorhizobium tarimense]|uniref:Uncharacterized protein n=1 Tax=Pseudorhizobium tarimense TaxID=1079109 RepID=A0ABV2HCH9_9HYPH|nr:hypothetical protein [Pseudorhizobium tarimense]